jgi:hypothetical protein
MIIPFDVDAIRQFSLKDDTEPKTVFKLGYLDAQESAWLDAEFSKVEMKGRGDKMEPEIKIDIAGKYLEVVRLKLKGADNFGIDFKFTDKPYPFGKRRVLDEKSLNAVKSCIAELAQEILKESTLSGEQEKN